MFICIKLSCIKETAEFKNPLNFSENINFVFSLYSLIKKKLININETIYTFLEHIKKLAH